MHCPSFEIFGTFFPSWMLCALAGAIATAMVFKVLTFLSIHDFLFPKVVTYGAVFLNVTLLAWNHWFGH